jgi:hypothetical protein
LLRCLKCCYESKFEQLNVDMNFFLLLKNELSMFFLRKEENVMQTLKSAIHIEANQRNSKRAAQIEEDEINTLQKLLTAT